MTVIEQFRSRPNKRIAAALVVVFLFATTALAQDHLTPPGADDGKYRARLAAVFHAAFRRNVLLRAIVNSSSANEKTVGIRRVGGHYTIFGLAAGIEVYDYSILDDEKFQCGRHGKGICERAEIARLEASLPSNYHDVPVSRCEVPIARDLALRIANLWKQMLSQTRDVRTDPESNQDETILTDGVWFFFSMPDGSRQLVGEAGYPSGHARTDEFAEISDAMYSICVAGDQGLLSNLDQKVDHLQKKISDDRTERAGLAK